MKNHHLSEVQIVALQDTEWKHFNYSIQKRELFSELKGEKQKNPNFLEENIYLFFLIKIKIFALSDLAKNIKATPCGETTEKEKYTLAEICFFPRKKLNMPQQREPILLSWYVHSYQQSPVHGF